MTELRTVERPCNIKVNDSGTKIQFYAYDDNGRISFTQNDTLLFKIKNSMGYVTEVQGQSASGGYIAELNSSDLQVLTPDTYFIELWVTQNGNTTIYPDNAFCPIAVTQNVMSIAGNVLPTTSLVDFENSLKAYVEQQASTATTSIKNDFQSYVDSITDSTIKVAEKASQDAQSAISTANGAVDTANTAKSTAESAVSTANTAKSTADTATTKANNAQSTADSATTKANNAQSTADSANSKTQANASLIASINGIVNNWNSTAWLPQPCDFNKMPTGIYSCNGWGDLSGVANKPSFLGSKWSTVLIFQNGYSQHQFVFEEWGTIHYRTVKVSDGSTLMDWKTIAFNS